MVRADSLFALAIIESRRGDFGTLVDHENDEYQDPCPFCGCKTYVAFLDREWKGNESSPDDAFECFGCGAVGTRRDFFGGDHEWDKDAARRGLN